MNLNDMQVHEEPTMDEMQEWFALEPKIKELQARETHLREKITNFYFPQPEEGTNRIDMPFDPSWNIECGATVTRSVDPAALDAYQQELIDACIDVSSLLKYKASLDTTAYRKLSDESRKVFDNVLVIKPGKPSLKFVPKKVKG